MYFASLNFVTTHYQMQAFVNSLLQNLFLCSVCTIFAAVNNNLILD